MNREEVIRLSYAASKGNLSNSDVSMLLIQYCMENGESYDNSAVFVSTILGNPNILSHCITHALEWYQKKFNIIKLYSAPNLMALGGERSIILIY